MGRSDPGHGVCVLWDDRSLRPSGKTDLQKALWVLTTRRERGVSGRHLSRCSGRPPLGQPSDGIGPTPHLTKLKRLDWLGFLVRRTLRSATKTAKFGETDRFWILAKAREWEEAQATGALERLSRPGLEEVPMTRPTVLALIVCLTFAPLAVAAPEEEPSMATVFDSIFEPVYAVYSWVVEVILRFG